MIEGFGDAENRVGVHAPPGWGLRVRRVLGLAIITVFTP